MKHSCKIKFSEEEKHTINNTAYRNALIENGCYSIPQHKVCKNKKKYDRKLDKRVCDLL